MSKALEILKELDNQDIWVLLELGLEHTNIASAIAELEAQKAKSCEGCKYNYDIDNFDSIDGKRLDNFRPNECYMCSRNMQDRFELKA